MKRKFTERFSDVMIYVVIGLVTLTCILPFLQVASTSVSSDSAVLSQRVFLIPNGFTLSAYNTVLHDASMIHSLWFTALLTISFTILSMFLITCAAYPLTKTRLKGYKTLTLIFIITMYFSAGTIPDFLLINSLGLYNTVWSLLLPGAFNVFNMIIFRSFIYNTIPPSLEEAAILDGCTDFGILFRIVLPLSAPVIATLCLFAAVSRWNGFADALYYIQSQDLYPLQLKLNMLVAASSSPATVEGEVGLANLPNAEVIKAACIMFATIPIVIVYPFVQRYFVKGVMIGAVKG
jgi:putative aldouronate transport system permease protein